MSPTWGLSWADREYDTARKTLGRMSGGATRAYLPAVGETTGDVRWLPLEGTCEAHASLWAVSVTIGAFRAVSMGGDG